MLHNSLNRPKKIVGMSNRPGLLYLSPSITISTIWKYPNIFKIFYYNIDFSSVWDIYQTKKNKLTLLITQLCVKIQVQGSQQRDFGGTLYSKMYCYTVKNLKLLLLPRPPSRINSIRSSFGTTHGVWHNSLHKIYS